MAKLYVGETLYCHVIIFVLFVSRVERQLIPMFHLCHREDLMHKRANNKNHECARGRDRFADVSFLRTHGCAHSPKDCLAG